MGSKFKWSWNRLEVLTLHKEKIWEEQQQQTRLSLTLKLKQQTYPDPDEFPHKGWSWLPSGIYQWAVTVKHNTLYFQYPTQPEIQSFHHVICFCKCTFENTLKNWCVSAIISKRYLNCSLSIPCWKIIYQW
jgi:hypothetical protein